MIALRLFLFALLVAAMPARAQVWELLPEDDSRAGPVATICPDDETGDAFCFTVGCADGGPVHYEVAYNTGTPLDPLLVGIDVDGQPVGTLAITPAPDEDVYRYRAEYDARLHRELIARLRGGNRAALIIGADGGIIRRDISLRGSSRAIAAVIDACPEPPRPMLPLTAPAAQVLAQIEDDCAALGGTVEVEPGFERAEDLDGDGRTDMVVDFAAAVCSEMASLHCGSGGCKVGFYLNRETEFQPLFVDVIRGYDSAPGGLLTLDLHGSFCGVFGYEACLQRFDISGGDMVLLDELTGEAAIAVLEGAPLPSLEPPEVLETADQPGLPRSEAWPDRPATGPGTEVVLAGLSGAVLAPLPPLPEMSPGIVPLPTISAPRSDAVPVIALPEADLAPPRPDTAPGGVAFDGVDAPALAPPVAMIVAVLAERSPARASAPPMPDMPEPPIYPETGESLDPMLLGGGGVVLTSPDADATGADRLGLDPPVGTDPARLGAAGGKPGARP